MLPYRKFIDEMVLVARGSVLADRIRASGHPVRTNETALPLDDEEAGLKTLFLALDPQHRELLARLVLSEREGAVHDVLAYLEWATVTEVLDYEGAGFVGTPDNTMHGDLMARLSGWEWPE